MKRRLFLGSLAAAALAGCKDGSGGGDPGLGLVKGAPDVAIKSVRILSAPENSVQGDTFYLITFTYTNGLNRDFVPQLNKFIFEDTDKRRHQGTDSGSTAIVGMVHWPTDVLPKGASRDYTAAFQVYQNTQGTLLYDPA